MAWETAETVSSNQENTNNKNIIIPSVCIGIPYRDKFSLNVFKSLYTLELPPVYDFAFDGGSRPLDLSRNIIVSMALAQGFEYLFFIDSDIVFPDKLTLKKLVMKREPIIGAIYPGRANTAFFVGAETGGKPLAINDPRVEKGELIEMDHIGMGATLIHTSVFKNIGQNRRWRCLTNHREETETGVYDCSFDEAEKNHFLCQHCKGLLVCTFFHYTHGKFSGDESDEDGFPMYIGSEDYYFCELAKRAGYSIKLDTGTKAWHETSEWLATDKGLITMSKGNGAI